jgi:NADPH:quinone reductase-like Zn-dependent oxidoreductase
MKAARVQRFGPPDVINIEAIPLPVPEAGEVLVRVSAAGVGPWDAWIREGQSKVSPPLPLTLGSDLCGTIEAVGADVSHFKPGDWVYGVTNPQFCGANAEYAVAFARMIAAKPARLSPIEAASAPVVAVTAWQMLFDYARAAPGQTVLIHGGAGNVGAYAVQLAKQAGLDVIATASLADANRVRQFGADTVVDYRKEDFEATVSSVDIVLDTVGGDVKRRSFGVLKDTGILVSIVSANSVDVPPGREKQAVYFIVDVTTARLQEISKLFESGRLLPQVGAVLDLVQIRKAHDMLAGAPHALGKIVLRLED